MPLDARYRAASQAHAGLILVPAKTFPQDRSFTAAITSALSALLDQPGSIQPGHALFLTTGNRRINNRLPWRNAAPSSIATVLRRSLECARPRPGSRTGTYGSARDWRPDAAAAARDPVTASSLLLLVEVSQQAERALEHLGRDKAGGQALFDLQADQHRLPDGPDLDGRDPRGELITTGAIGVG